MGVHVFVSLFVLLFTILIDQSGSILIVYIPGSSCWGWFLLCFASYSGRWDESLTRDNEGRNLRDYDYDLIETIVNYLREKKIEDPSDPLTHPYVLPHKKIFVTLA